MIGRVPAAAPRSLWPWMVVAGGSAVALSGFVAVRSAPVWGDIALTRRVQGTPLLPDVAKIVNPLGDGWQWLYLGAALLVLASGRRIGGGVAGSRLRREAYFAVLGAAVLRPLSGALKEIVESPRPSPAFGVRIDHLRADFGFPSGHVYGDVLILGVLAVYARAFFSPRYVEPFRMFVAVVVVLAGPSRLVVGAHWPSDVLGGYLWGAWALLLVIMVGRWGGRRGWTSRGQGAPDGQKSSGDVAEFFATGEDGPPTQRAISAEVNPLAIEGLAGSVTIAERSG